MTTGSWKINILNAKLHYAINMEFIFHGKKMIKN